MARAERSSFAGTQAVPSKVYKPGAVPLVTKTTSPALTFVNAARWASVTLVTTRLVFSEPSTKFKPSINI